ncbi:MAG: hypothetical protein NT001_00110 [Candidatus Woesearchaeota archaeon]|nr:hypothetical protein [Candidatus Woesearchaeota archaeon]
MVGLFRNLSMNKKAQGWDDMKSALLTVLAVSVIAGLLFIVLYPRAGQSTIDKINWVGDYDGDYATNKDDKCCAAACNPAGFEIGECPGEWCGCTALQGYTNCSSSVCNLDFDHDKILNKIDQCCAPQCAPADGEEVNTVDCTKTPVGTRCGCAANQIPTKCDADIGVACSNQVQQNIVNPVG